MSDNDIVTPADIAAELMLDAARDIDALAISERLDETEMPDEPDGFAEQVAELVKTASIAIDWPDTSDGTINVGDGLVGALVAKLGQERDAFALAAEQNASELDKLRAQVADLADKLHKANAEIASHTKAGTAWANEVAAKDKVIEAAKAWIESSVADFGRTGDALTAAVEALPKKAESELADRRHPIAEQGCDNCAVEPGERHRYWGCPEAGPADAAEVA